MSTYTVEYKYRVLDHSWHHLKKCDSFGDAYRFMEKAKEQDIANNRRSDWHYRITETDTVYEDKH